MVPYVLSICFICSTKYLDLKIGAYQLAHIKSLYCRCCAVCCVLRAACCIFFSQSPDETIHSIFFFVSFPLLCSSVLLFSFFFFRFLNPEELGLWCCDDSNVIGIGIFLSPCLEMSLCPKCSCSRIRNNDSNSK